MTNKLNNNQENEAVSKLGFDVLVIGGGIAGQEASLNLANNGFKVLLVEKDLSIGGDSLLIYYNHKEGIIYLHSTQIIIICGICC
jgi:Heterodisulfide reductase, subunit A and related polyferredoxins